MMTAKHAPGPWKWDGNPCDYNPEQEAPWLVDANDSYPPILGGTVKCRSSANARLIAAAPDLLEALEDAASTQPADSPIKWVLRARAAIAKATGETK